MKYLLEGIAITLVAFAFTKRNFTPKKAINTVLTSALVFAVLDNFVGGELSKAARFGSGFGVGSTFGVGGASGPMFPSN